MMAKSPPSTEEEYAVMVPVIIAQAFDLSGAPLRVVFNSEYKGQKREFVQIFLYEEWQSPRTRAKAAFNALLDYRRFVSGVTP